MKTISPRSYFGINDNCVEGMANMKYATDIGYPVFFILDYCNPSEFVSNYNVCIVTRRPISRKLPIYAHATIERVLEGVFLCGQRHAQYWAMGQ
jgi:hypothetical protein